MQKRLKKASYIDKAVLAVKVKQHFPHGLITLLYYPFKCVFQMLELMYTHT